MPLLSNQPPRLVPLYPPQEQNPTPTGIGFSCQVVNIEIIFVADHQSFKEQPETAEEFSAKAV
ncbi:hypothetical protein LINPERPRIM_LOCUS30808 [Linum perenne]